MAQNFIYSPWERSKSPWLWLMTTLLLFNVLWLFFFVSAFLISLIKRILSLLLKFSMEKKADRKHGARGWGHKDHRVLLCFTSNEYSALISFKIDWFDLPACPMDSQESSPAPQFESINSKALTLLYGPTLRSIHDCWKNHSFDYMHFCQQSDVSAFWYVVWVCHSFSSKEQTFLFHGYSHGP